MTAASFHLQFTIAGHSRRTEPELNGRKPLDSADGGG